MLELILGGARSGKSLLAEQRAKESGRRVLYIATAELRDTEMRQRIAHHQARRPPEWGLIEAPLQLTEALQQHAAADTCILVDCMTLWLTNWLYAGQAATQAEAQQPVDCALLRKALDDLHASLPHLPGQIVMVSNEVGSGIVPMHPVSRLFADEQGRLNQAIAAYAQRVTLVVAGLPLSIK